MATRVNKNIDWITDDEGFVVGYDRGLRRAVGIPRVSDDGQGLVFPDQSDPIARINERLRGVSKRGSLSLPLRIIGFPAISASTNVTRHLARILPTEFSAWRVRVYNAHASSISYKVAVATGTNEAEIAAPLLTYTKATFNGADSVAVPAGSGTIPNHAFGTAVSDVMFSGSVANARMLYLRTWCNVANNTRFDLSANFYGIPEHGFYGMYQNGVNAVDDATLFSSPVPHNSMPPIAIELFSSSQVRKMLLCGSSTAHGQGDAVTAGWHCRTERALNTGSLTVYSLSNISAPGSTTEASFARGLKEIAEIPYDAAAFWVYSSNDADKDTEAGHNRRKAQMIRWIEECKDKGVKPVLVTFQPGTWMVSPNQASYTYCKAANDYARQLSALGHCDLLDLSDVLTDESQSSPTWRNATWTTDGTHPNSDGSAAIAVYSTAAIRSILDA